MTRTATVVALIAVACSVAACGRDNPKVASCFDLSAPGTIVYVPGIDLTVRDAQGHGDALGATFVVYRGADSLTAVGRDSLHQQIGFGESGTFSVRVSKPYYRDLVVPNVAVRQGQCAVATTELAVTLQLAPNAPAIRSVGITGTDFLYAPGVQLTLGTVVDADPGVATNVTWILSDTTLASVTPNGVVTAKCSTAGGTDSVTAIAVADTSVRGSAVFGVAKSLSCS